MTHLESFIIDTYRYWCYESSKPIEKTNETKQILCRKERFVYGIGMTIVYFANGFPVELIQGKILNQHIITKDYKSKDAHFIIKALGQKQFIFNEHIASENP